MRTLSISILSDLHLDMHFKSSRHTTGEIKVFFDQIFKPGGIEPADVLVIAGDLGHYNSQNLWIIEFLKGHYFKHVICVLGNHDYYLLHRLQQLDYNMNSFERVQEMREQLNAIEGIHCLNGNVVEIEGIRFGGCDSWYDGQYGMWLYDQKGTKGDWMQRLWTMSMNDSRLIYGIKRFDEIWDIEKPKIESVYRECDVIVRQSIRNTLTNNIGTIRKPAFSVSTVKSMSKTLRQKYGSTAIPIRPMTSNGMEYG